MNQGPNITFQYLAKTENEAAVELLVAGLDSKSEKTHRWSLRALLQRRSESGHIEVFKRLSRFDQEDQEIIAEHPARLVRIVAEALKDPNPKAVQKACATVQKFRLYDAVPALISQLVQENNPHQPMLAEAVFKLVESFYAELSGDDCDRKRRDMSGLRDRITLDLEDAVRKFHRHRQPEAVEALLLLAKQKNVTLRDMLSRPDEASYDSIVELLRSSEQGGVMRLLLGLLEDPKAPLAVADVIGSRTDAKFVSHLAKTVGPKPPRSIAESLQRIRSILWADASHPVFKELDDEAQQGAIQILLHSSMDERSIAPVLSYLAKHGKPRGREAALRALAGNKQPHINKLFVEALGDEDPGVRAAAIVQLRPRQVSGSLSLLIAMVDDDHDEVLAALREAMPEFSFQQFLANFDDMPEELRPVSGHLVMKIDTNCPAKLEHEMKRPSPVGRRRAILAALSMGLVHALEKRIIELLQDEDHIVRVAAAKALADCKSAPSWEALRDAMLDRSYVVQEAAEESLQRISSSLLQHCHAEAHNAGNEAGSDPETATATADADTPAAPLEGAAR